MTTADKLRAEGEARGEAKGWTEGRAKGLAEGWADGMAAGAAANLLRLMTSKFGPLDHSTRWFVLNSSGEQIGVWTDRVLTAETLDDVLA